MRKVVLLLSVLAMASVAAAIPPPVITSWAEDMNDAGPYPIATIKSWHNNGLALGIYEVTEASIGAVRGTSFTGLAEADGDQVLEIGITGKWDPNLHTPLGSRQKTPRVYQTSLMIAPGSPGFNGMGYIGVYSDQNPIEVATGDWCNGEITYHIAPVPGTNPGTQAIMLWPRGGTGYNPGGTNWPMIMHSAGALIDLGDTDGDGFVIEFEQGVGRKFDGTNAGCSNGILIADNLPGNVFIDVQLSVDTTNKGVVNQTFDWDSTNSFERLGDQVVTWNGAMENIELEYAPINVMVQYRDAATNDLVPVADVDLGVALAPAGQIDGDPSNLVIGGCCPISTGSGWIDWLDVTRLSPAGDTDADGDVDAADQANFLATTGWGDFDQDGTPHTAADQALLTANMGLDDSLGNGSWGTSGNLLPMPHDFDFTIPGDANHDGNVNDQDLSLLLTGWPDTQNPTNWRTGDFDDNNDTSDPDLSLLLSNWTVGSLGGSTVPPSGAVPEPATLALLGLGALALVRKRR